MTRIGIDFPMNKAPDAEIAHRMARKNLGANGRKRREGRRHLDEAARDGLDPFSEYAQWPSIASAFRQLADIDGPIVLVVW